ncbi:MAG: methylmalonyl Co-A mutase-associated GTPase MeaB [Calditerricola sp.]|nr:methylmalonyl Co-A mutase-associated GTPase MeaB [Calditerricola sp.]
MDELAARVRAGDRRAVARAITWVENGHPEKDALLKRLYPHTGRAVRVGITGAPGAGKSSLVDRLVGHLRRQGLTVAVVAVDPTSPFTGGALLGDRVRMQAHATDPGVFIRSMGTRGHLGGLSRSTQDAVCVLDAAGFDVVLVETVGVGQSEVDVMHVVDTTVVVLTPGGGDVVQAFKAGIMEIADVFVVNKADRPGAEKVKAQVEAMLDLVAHDTPWRPPVVKTSASRGEGLDDLWQAIADHRAYLEQSGEGRRQRAERLRRDVLALAVARLECRLAACLEEPPFADLLAKVQAGAVDPYAAAEALIDGLLRDPDVHPRCHARVEEEV